MASLDGPIDDGVVSLRPSATADQDVLLQGRDDEFHRFLGEGSPEPAPSGCIVAKEMVVGWIDFDDQRHWLKAGEVNVGYNVFLEHRGKGYGTRALRLLVRFLGRQSPPLHPTLLIDPQNGPSLALAARAGFERVGLVDGQDFFRLVHPPS